MSGTSPTKLVEQLLNSRPVEERPVRFVGHTDSKASGSSITPRLLKGSGEWRARYSWKARLSPMNQSRLSRLPLSTRGRTLPPASSRSSLDPARSASQRRSPVVEGLPKKIFLSAARDTHLEFARCSRTIRKSSLWDHPLLRPWRMEAAASGTVTNRFTKIGLSEPAAIASVRRSRVTGPGTLSPLSYAATFVSDVPVARATCDAVNPALRRNSRRSQPSMGGYYQLLVIGYQLYSGSSRPMRSRGFQAGSPDELAFGDGSPLGAVAENGTLFWLSPLHSWEGQSDGQDVSGCSTEESQ